MDWRLQAYQQLHLEERHKRKRTPEPKSSRCRVLSIFENTTDSPKESAQKMVDQELGFWLDSGKDADQAVRPLQSQHDAPQKKEPEPHRDGFILLLCGRPEPVDGEEVRANFSNMPFKKATSNANSPREDDIKTILERFHVHAHMGQVIKRRTPYFSVADMTDSEKGKIPFLIRSYINLMAAPFPADTEKTVYTAIFDTGMEDFKANLAFTSTYFHSYRTSFGIILGCTEGDVKKATTLLKECRSSQNHQLLLPAVFLELQRQRLANIRKRHTTKALELQGNFEEARDHKSGMKPFKFGNRPLNIAESTIGLPGFCTDSNIMAEDMRIASRQLSRLKRHAEELAESQAKELENFKETPDAEKKKLTWDNTRCFPDLFDEIADDVDLVSGAVTLNSKAATTMADEMIRTSLKQDTRWNMGLAFVAMAYLPITALATIFAMPVFDFKAHWRDMDNQPANWSESSDDPASANPSSPPPPVMSIYFTYWISTSIVLTWLTIEGWWFFSSEVEEWRWDRFWSLRQLAGVVEGVIEIPLWVFKWLGEAWSWVVILIAKCRSSLEDDREKRRKLQDPESRGQ